eukprot:m.25542 g.25542  ORF g.25542 m.25542 type:complete len:566 (-) comp5775_c0_seq1:248-1945(-)
MSSFQEQLIFAVKQKLASSLAHHDTPTKESNHMTSSLHSTSTTPSSSDVDGGVYLSTASSPSTADSTPIKQKPARFPSMSMAEEATLMNSVIDNNNNSNNNNTNTIDSTITSISPSNVDDSLRHHHQAVARPLSSNDSDSVNDEELSCCGSRSPTPPPLSTEKHNHLRLINPLLIHTNQHHNDQHHHDGDTFDSILCHEHEQADHHHVEMAFVDTRKKSSPLASKQVSISHVPRVARAILTKQQSSNKRKGLIPIKVSSTSTQLQQAGGLVFSFDIDAENTNIISRNVARPFKSKRMTMPKGKKVPSSSIQNKLATTLEVASQPMTSSRSQPLATPITTVSSSLASTSIPTSSIPTPTSTIVPVKAVKPTVESVVNPTVISAIKSTINQPTINYTTNATINHPTTINPLPSRSSKALKSKSPKHFSSSISLEKHAIADAVTSFSSKKASFAKARKSPTQQQQPKTIVRRSPKKVVQLTSSSPSSSHAGSHHHPVIAPNKKGKKCACCQTTTTPLWRDIGRTLPLCNACGIRYKKYSKICGNCHYVPCKQERDLPCCKKCNQPQKK